MKGLITGVLAVLIAGGVTYGVVANQNEPDSKMTTAESGDPIPIPTERTVELAAGAEYPWEGISEIKEATLIEQGEVVYLMSDLEAFENVFPNMIDLDIIQNEANPEVVQARITNILSQLEPLKPDMGDYWNKLREAKEAVASGEYELAKTKVAEAKQLRLQ